MSETGRVHPAAILIWLSQDVRKAALGLLPVLTFGSWGLLIAGGMLALVLIQAAIKYFVFTYRIEGDTLLVSGGLLFRWKRVIPVARVQSVEIVQGIIHRVFGVVELRVEAIGGKESEAAIPALTPSVAEAMRVRLLSGATIEAGSRSVSVTPPPLVSLTPRQLIVAGLTGGRVAVLAALLGYLAQFESRMDRLFGLVGDSAGSLGLLLALGIAISFLLVSFVISLVATLVVYWGFTLRLHQSRLLIERGLLESRSSSIPVGRIQAITVRENPIRRLLNLACSTVTVAGFESQGQDKEERTMLLPISSRSDAFSIVRHVLGLEVNEEVLEALPSRALAKRLTLATPAAVVIAIAGQIAGAGWVVAGLALGIGILTGVFLSWRVAGHSVEDDLVIVRRGILVRKTAVVPTQNIQHVVLVRSPVQRLFGLGSVRLGVPKAAQDLADGTLDVAHRRFELLAARLTAS